MCAEYPLVLEVDAGGDGIFGFDGADLFEGAYIDHLHGMVGRTCDHLLIIHPTNTIYAVVMDLLFPQQRDNLVGDLSFFLMYFYFVVGLSLEILWDLPDTQTA